MCLHRCSYTGATRRTANEILFLRSLSQDAQNRILERSSGKPYELLRGAESMLILEIPFS